MGWGRIIGVPALAVSWRPAGRQGGYPAVEGRRGVAWRRPERSLAEVFLIMPLRTIQETRGHKTSIGWHYRVLRAAAVHYALFMAHLLGGGASYRQLHDPTQDSNDLEFSVEGCLSSLIT